MRSSRVQTEKQALYWEKAPEREGAAGYVHCLLCPKDCRIAPGRAGFCRVRRNVEGELFSANYGRVTSWAVDPVEKKPLYHFHPGSHLFSIGTLGCNLACGFCQNWTISQRAAAAAWMPPDEAVRLAVRERKAEPNLVGIAYTYSEPLVWFEHVLETSILARRNQLVNVLVTNGFVREEPLKELLPWVDAMNVDVKAFSGEFYVKACAGRLEPVLRTVEMAFGAGIAVEVTTLLVPGENDDLEEIERLASWLSSLSPDIPLHLSRYFPSHEYSLPPTPLDTLRKARALASKKLHHVYLGNVVDPEASATRCPGCRSVVLRREGMGVTSVALAEGARCPRCGRQLRVVGEPRVTR